MRLDGFGLLVNDMATMIRFSPISSPLRKPVNRSTMIIDGRDEKRIQRTEDTERHFRFFGIINLLLPGWL
jgi:hypothetical protein